MEQTLIHYCFNLLTEFAKFAEWMTVKLPNLGISPLEVFSFGGLTLIIGFLLVRLVVGG